MIRRNTDVTQMKHRCKKKKGTLITQHKINSSKIVATVLQISNNREILVTTRNIGNQGYNNNNNNMNETHIIKYSSLRYKN